MPLRVLSDGKKVRLYTADNGTMSFSVTDYGCIITNISVPDKKGDRSDIVSDYSTFEGYLNGYGTLFRHIPITTIIGIISGIVVFLAA